MCAAHSKPHKEATPPTVPSGGSLTTGALQASATGSTPGDEQAIAAMDYELQRTYQLLVSVKQQLRPDRYIATHAEYKAKGGYTTMTIEMRLVYAQAVGINISGSFDPVSPHSRGGAGRGDGRIVIPATQAWLLAKTDNPDDHCKYAELVCAATGPLTEIVAKFSLAPEKMTATTGYKIAAACRYHIFCRGKRPWKGIYFRGEASSICNVDTALMLYPLAVVPN